MRFMIKVAWDVEAGNAHAKNGTLGSTVQSILEDLKPEAAYFTAEGGKRGGIVIVDLDDASQIPAVAEPWFLAANASATCTSRAARCFPQRGMRTRLSRS